MRVYLVQELKNFQRFFGNSNLKLNDLHAIFSYAGIKQGGDKKYSAETLKAYRTGNSGMKVLYDAYRTWQEKTAEFNKKKANSPTPEQKQKVQKPVQLKLDLEENKKVKNIYITESQLDLIKKRLNEGQYFVNPEKVLIIKRYLDDNFVKASIPCMGSDGYPTSLPIVGLKGTDGVVMKNMTDKQLFFMLQNKYQKMFADTEERDKFLKQIIKDWYYDKITDSGMLSVNMF